MHKNFIEAILKEPGHPWRLVLVQNELDVLQGIVDGYIETVPAEAIDLPKAFGRHVIIVNDEGKLHDGRPNFDIWGGLDWVCGTALIVGRRRDEFWDCFDQNELLDYLEAHVTYSKYPESLAPWVPLNDDIIDRDVIAKMYEDRIFPATDLEETLDQLAQEWDEQDHEGWGIPEFTRTDLEAEKASIAKECESDD